MEVVSTGPQSPPQPPVRAGEREIRSTTAGRKAIGGFFLSGVLLAFLGAILPGWGYHIRGEFLEVGNHFFSLGVGIALCFWTAPPLLKRLGVGSTMVASCCLAFAALLLMSFFPPPLNGIWRMFALLLLGCASGNLHAALFQAISPLFRHDPAATVNLAGMLFGAGSLTVVLLVAGTFYVYTLSSIIYWVALIPATFAALFSRMRLPREVSAEPEMEQRPLKEVLADFRSPAAVLFALLLFFQFGNEWSLAGWLPLLLIQRLGISPLASLLLLALYFLCLIVGRVLAQWLLPVVRHGRLLMTSVVLSMFGCLILALTNNLFGAGTAVVFIGAGFAITYPLVIEKIGLRFRYYHPTLFNSIFSLAILGGLLAPWTLGFFANTWSVRAVMVVPLGGTLIVSLLLVLIWAEAKLTGVR